MSEELRALLYWEKMPVYFYLMLRAQLIHWGALAHFYLCHSLLLPPSPVQKCWVVEWKASQGQSLMRQHDSKSHISRGEGVGGVLKPVTHEQQ